MKNNCANKRFGQYEIHNSNERRTVSWVYQNHSNTIIDKCRSKVMLMRI